MPTSSSGASAAESDFVDEAVDFRVAESVDLRERLLLLVQPLAQTAGGVGMIEHVPAGLQLHLELGDRQRPGAQGLGQAALEVEEPLQAPRGFGRPRISPQAAGCRGESGRGTPYAAPRRQCAAPASSRRGSLAWRPGPWPCR